jgi:hypothetical protein
MPGGRRVKRAHRDPSAGPSDAQNTRWPSERRRGLRHRHHEPVVAAQRHEPVSRPVSGRVRSFSSRLTLPPSRATSGCQRTSPTLNSDTDRGHHASSRTRTRTRCAARRASRRSGRRPARGRPASHSGCTGWRRRPSRQAHRTSRSAGPAVSLAPARTRRHVRVPGVARRDGCVAAGRCRPSARNAPFGPEPRADRRIDGDAGGRQRVSPKKEEPVVAYRLLLVRFVRNGLADRPAAGSLHSVGT